MPEPTQNSGTSKFPHWLESLLASRDDIPPVVTFATGAPLLVQLGLVGTITPDGLRYIARTDPDWPFGPGRQHPYIQVGNARGMETRVFLAFFASGPARGGRGLNRS
ncbi:hypothetical protein [Streptomyces sp. NPDC101145]|uniref:hypothetical protein n=1 Tax=Streptomyces sp. NPDC101145 TaxID=3366112 RepID=UPI00381245AF